MNESQMAAKKKAIPQWLDATMPTRKIIRDYWQEEARLNSPALERLRQICEARGYSYELTVQALTPTPKLYTVGYAARWTVENQAKRSMRRSWTRR